MINRRQFVAGGALVLTGTALGQTRTRPKIGFLGVAHSHATEKVRIIRQMSEFDFVGIVEDSEKTREPFAKAGAKIISREELLNGADVVVVESEVRNHSRDAIQALMKDKHVHVEKPPSAKMSEFEEMVKLAREKQRLLQVGYMWRYNPGFNRAIEAAKSGWLGEVYLVRATMNSLIDARRRPEWGEFKGGAMFELGCHVIDAVIRLLGKPTKVTPHLQRRGSDGLADNCVAVFEFPKAQAIVTNSTLTPNSGPQRFLEILGTNGVARVQPIEAPSLSIELAKPAGPYRAGSQTVELPEYRRYVGEFAELALALRGEKKLPVTLDEELVIHEAILRASDMY
jgi:predicted dehydrogenase